MVAYQPQFAVRGDLDPIQNWVQPSPHRLGWLQPRPLGLFLAPKEGWVTPDNLHSKTLVWGNKECISGLELVSYYVYISV